MQSLKLECRHFRPFIFPWRSFTTSTGPLQFRQKIAYKTRYHWMLDLKKSRTRAQYPWIPREPPTILEIDGQQIEFPEMHLDIVVPPDLDKFNLKPYVAWRAKYADEKSLTAEYLFEKKYAAQIKEMFDSGYNKEQILEKIKS